MEQPTPRKPQGEHRPRTSNSPYNYQQLDDFLQKDKDPHEVGDQLDDTMSDLVEYASKEETYSQALPERHYLLRRLRDIFWHLKKQA